jgi:hypothetical protein
MRATLSQGSAAILGIMTRQDFSVHPPSDRSEQRANLVIDRRSLVLGSLALPLVGCSWSVRRYRYKLALEVEVDGKTLREFNVVESWAYDVSFPESGVRTGLTGESIVVEIRPGRVLVPLLRVITEVPDTTRGGNWTKQRGDWGKFREAYGYKRPVQEDSKTYWSSLNQFRGEREWSLDDLPDLVTFDNVNDPRTVKLVDPRNLEASFGPGVRLTRATIAIVDNSTPLTKGIEKKLPWIVELKGNYLVNFGTTETATSNNSLVSKLHGGFFATGIFK